MKIGKIVAAGMMVTVVGCGGRKAPGTYIADKSCYLTNLTPSAVIIKVNGEKLCRRDFDSIQSFYGKMYRMSRGIDLVARDARAAIFVRNREQRVIPEFLREALLRQEADRLGIEAPGNLVREHGRELAKALKRPGKSIDELAAEFGNPEGRVFRRLLEGDVRDNVLRQTVGSNDLIVTEADIIAGTNRLASFNARAAASNAWAHATAKRLADELRKGGDFEALGKKFGQVSPSECKLWQSTLITDLDPPALSQWVKKADAGAVSDPIEMDDGLSIVKLLRIGKSEDPSVPNSVDLARITFYLFEPAEPMTHDEIRNSLAKYNMEQVQKKLMQRLVAAAVIEYPNGTNLFPEATEEMKKPVFFPKGRVSK